MINLGETIQVFSIEPCVKQTAAHLLSVSIQSVFPSAQINFVQADDLGFYCDVSFDFPFSQKELPLIEERMRTIAKTDSDFTMKEMVPFCAKQYFIDQRVGYRAFAWEGENRQLIRFIDYNGILDLCDEEIQESFAVPSFFYLYQIEERGDFVRIRGTIANDKPQLKAQKKAIKEGERRYHLNNLNCSLYSWIKDQVYWKSEGTQLIHGLLENLESLRTKNDFIKVVTPQNRNFEENHKLFFEANAKKVPFRCFEVQRVYDPDQAGDRGLLNSQEYTKELACSFCQFDQILKECISSLQFIQKISTIVQLYGKVLLCGASSELVQGMKSVLAKWDIPYIVDAQVSQNTPLRVQMRLQDGMLRDWDGPYIEVKRVSSDIFQVIHSVYPSMERTIALLIEQEKIKTEKC